MTSPSASLIILTHNRPHFINQAVESALSQVYSPVQIIVVNNGACLETHKNLSPYIKNKQITYIEVEECGRSAARNAGLESINGEYVSFLDDDDELLPEFYSTLIPLMEAYPHIGIILCNCYDQEGNSKRINADYSKLTPENLFPRFLHGNFVPNMCMVFRRSVMANHRFDDTLHTNEDYDFLMKMATPDNLYLVDHPLAVYHKHAENVSNKQTNNMNNRFYDLQASANIWIRYQDHEHYRSIIRKSFIKKFFSIAHDMKQEVFPLLLSFLDRNPDLKLLSFRLRFFYFWHNTFKGT